MWDRKNLEWALRYDNWKKVVRGDYEETRMALSEKGLTTAVAAAKWYKEQTGEDVYVDAGEIFDFSFLKGGLQ